MAFLVLSDTKSNLKLTIGIAPEKSKSLVIYNRIRNKLNSDTFVRCKVSWVKLSAET